MGAYLKILAVPGALAFCLAGLLARFGGAMIGIGTILMASALYDSYGVAGALSAANAIAWAIGTAVLSNMVDRFGQRRIMLPAALISAITLAAMVGFALIHAPLITLFISTILSGFCAGSPGAMVRSRWNYVLSSSHELHTAYSLESTLDEVCFAVGPVLATLLATSVHPAAGLIGPIVFGAGGAMIFYSLRATQPKVIPREPGVRGQSRFILLFPGLASLLGVGLLMGSAFGAIDVSTVAATSAWDRRYLAGVILGIMSLGSATGGLLYGSRAWASPLRKRYTIGVLFFGVAVCTLPFAVTPLLLGVLGFVAGFAIAPTFVNANGLIGHLVPSSRLTEGLAWLGTSIGIGVSFGATVSGQLIDIFGYRAGFCCVAASGLLACAIALASARPTVSAVELS
ncbi:MAG: MFS transporter [Propionibacteriaceae bacterium]|nr:MFS transporter [Propionibacteriaceae bacterium]